MMEERLRAFMTRLYEAGMSPGDVVREGYDFATHLAWGDALQDPPALASDVMDAASILLHSVSLAMNLHVACDLERMDRIEQLQKRRGMMP